MLGELQLASEIIISHNYATAVSAIELHKPHIIILDIHLPDKSGIDLLDYLATTHPVIKIIMLTNKTAEFYKELCLKKGASFFLDKSKDFEKIVPIVESIYQL